jgi:hypothetical protein
LALAATSSALAAVVAVIALAGCGASGSGQSSAASGGGSQTTTSASPDATAAASAYETAFNTMIGADNAGIMNQNSNDASTCSKGIQARITARRQFDASMHAIDMPASLSSDAQAVLSSDAALEQALGNLQANVSDVASYNHRIQPLKQDEDHFRAANTTLANALGLTIFGRGGASAPSAQ